MAMIVDAIAGKVLERVTGLVEEKAIMVLGVKDELQKLQRTMKRVGLLLKDAEKKSIEDESMISLTDACMKAQSFCKMNRIVVNRVLLIRRAYRSLYILNWIYRYFTEPHYVHWITWISGLVQTLLYADFFLLLLQQLEKQCEASITCLIRYKNFSSTILVRIHGKIDLDANLFTSHSIITHHPLCSS